MGETISNSEEIQIGDTENFRGENQEFSHSALVRLSMIKCIQAGSVEMHEGINVTYKDNKGNYKIVYKDDTTKAFIENVKNCEMVMSCDLDKDAKKNINELKDLMIKKRLYFQKQEEEEFKNLNNQQKAFLKKKDIVYRKGFLSTKNVYYGMWMEFKVETYRKIFSELTKLTKRLDFYKGSDFEA